MLNLEEDHITNEVITTIAELADQAKGAAGKLDILEVPHHPEKLFLLVKPDGSSEELFLPEAPRHSQLLTVSEVPPFVRTAIDKWSADPVVYYNPKQVYVRLNERELVPSNLGFGAVNLTFSDQWKMLSSFASNIDGAFKGQKAFLIMLRIQLAACFEDDVLSQLVRSLESYDSMEGERTVGVVSRNRESIGKEIKAELKSHAGEVPEQIRLFVRIFKDPALQVRRTIRCKIEIDPNNGGKFALLPMAEELDNALDNEMTDLGELLRSSINGVKRLNERSSLDFGDSPEVAQTAKSASPMKFVPIFYGQF